MTLRKSVAYSAVALAFAAGGAFAQTSTERGLSISANPNVGVDAKLGVDQSAATSQPSGQASGQASGSTSAQASTGETESSAAAGGSASGDVKHENKDEKKTGLDRADEVAGEHGKHGRDNARAKQGG